MIMAQKYHVVMLPWVAFGHMIPFLELSKSLAMKGITISYISTPRNIQRLPPIPPNLTAMINLVKIPLAPIDGLPEMVDATIDVPLQMVQYLKKAYDALRSPFECLVANLLPDLIVYDFASWWAAEIAAKYEVRSAFFSVFSAASLAFLGPPLELKYGHKRTKPEDLMVVPEWVPFTSTVAHRPDQARSVFKNLKFPDGSGSSSGQRFALAFEGCDIVIIRSCREFEGEYINLLKDLHQKPVIPVGLLPPSPSNPLIGMDSTMWSTTFEWLNQQQSNSTVFVGFGSEYKMTSEQVHELAFGLELSKMPFLWVLRKPEDTIDGSDLLPNGFEARTAGRGIVTVGWAPQLELLAHRTIGGCLFHSGWGSIVESLHYGHALILLPMMADQGLNARLLVDKGVGHEVERNEDGSFDRGAIAKAMRHVMVDKEGEPLRQKARQMRDIFGDGELHQDYIHRFLLYFDDLKRMGHTHSLQKD
ncbi:putative UDP-rhamnose:rhamnosyltransferase 1 [Magnolia sinica]|uniref:putative UDP-rhamnose:rhamnosyltransferase 1 n=1 Tax=Magnolia sinica TaxID=86752 RepID=UPI0026588C41|nr:putative UDP-rhamnose:rhamnosyltransferase 1 [Magnolia sinica]